MDLNEVIKFHGKNRFSATQQTISTGASHFFVYHSIEILYALKRSLSNQFVKQRTVPF